MKSTQASTLLTRMRQSVPPWLTGRTGIWVLAATLYAVVYSSWIFFKWVDPAYDSLIAGFGYLPLGLFCAISSAYVGFQKQLDPQTRRAWRLIAISIVFLAVADIIYVSLELARTLEFPDIPDILYLAFYPLAFWGFITIPTRVIDPSQEKTWALDLSVIVTGITSIFWYFIIAPTGISGGEDWLSRIVSGAYPALDMLLIGSIASLLFRRSDTNTRQSLYLLGLGLVVYIFADIAYAIQLLQDQYFSGSWMDFLWTLSYLIMGIGAVRQIGPVTHEPEDDKKPAITWQASLLPFLAVASGVFLSFYAASTGNGAGLPTNGLILGTAISVVIITVRQIITIRENSRLVEAGFLVADQLKANAEILEQRVGERTRELKTQSNQLRLVAEIARDITSAGDLQELLDRSTNSILRGFKHDHTAIYFLDEQLEFASLVSSPSEAGQKLISENFKVKIRDISLFEKIITSEHARITLEAEREFLQSRKIWLPTTQSAMTFPLKAENKIVGILDIQSDQPSAFHQDEMNIMEILADQLASAIERTRLAQEVKGALEELERSYGRHTQEGWRNFSASGLLKNRGYRFDNIRIEPITALKDFAKVALETGTIVNSKEDDPSQEIAIPIKLRGQTIGAVHARLNEGSSVTAVSTLQFAIDRLATALESARLYEQASLRADREHAISQITNAIGSSSELEAIMRTTVRELGNFLNDSDVTIQILKDNGVETPAQQH